jgi:Ni,Fe-hydrogenase III small subunit/ferredoxin
MAIWTLFGLLEGKATTSWPNGADDGQKGVLGMPRYRAGKCDENCISCADVCPTRAIAFDAAKSGPPKSGPRLTIDYGRCVVCQLCVEACPDGAMEASQDWAFGVRDRSDLVLDDAPAAEAKKKPPAPPFRRSLHIRHVDAGSCNGCESELQALNNPFYNLHRFGIFFTPSPRFADVLLVTGPGTYAMRDIVKRTYDAMPDPKWVVAVGACAVSGGIAEGGYAGGYGIDDLVPVDVYLPGCPPNPAAIIQALLMLLDRAPQRVSRGRHGE